MDDHEYEEWIKVFRKDQENALKEYFERPNQKLEESIKNLTDMELFVLSMLVLSDDFLGRTENKPKEIEQGEWLIVGEEQGAFDIIYKIRKCSKCGWEHSLLIPDDYCPKCGMRMKKEVKNEQ